ncbi:hypothetical protein C8P63_10290 [Melghirimyces profundicolus]|uniref:Uncharacterized protein n=1 Tax=Melghirimyces profundicolus TaxID=1242148 RepID=A0A2T6C8J6_9BACL|nr:hypothetical protein C8P63_10290 [Melghirimyces profundicolus]
MSGFDHDGRFGHPYNHQAGDHTLFIGEVTDLLLKEGNPLWFCQGPYRRLAAQTDSETG